jgi:hypothetical protein
MATQLELCETLFTEMALLDDIGEVDSMLLLDALASCGLELRVSETNDAATNFYELIGKE